MKTVLALCIILIFIGCTRNIPSMQERQATAWLEAQSSNLQEHIYKANDFNLFSYETSLNACENIDIFIEGDGLAWITKHKISSNPTPLKPIGLHLM